MPSSACACSVSWLPSSLSSAPISAVSTSASLSRCFERGRIGMRGENVLERRAEPNDAAARVAVGQGELQQAVETGLGSAVDFLVIADHMGQALAFEGERQSLPKHHSRTDFCAWMRFSASSNTTDCGPSNTLSLTSSPTMRGQAVEEGRVGLRARHQRLVDLERRHRRELVVGMRPGPSTPRCR